MRKELYGLDPKPEDLVVSRLKNCSNTIRRAVSVFVA